MAKHKLSVRRSCSAMQVSRASYYEPGQDRLAVDREIIDALQALIAKKQKWGFWKCYDRFRLEGRTWNYKRVYLVYCALGLNQPRRTKKRLPARERQRMEVIAAANQTWSIDFMSDSLYCGRRYRTLNILYKGVREVLGIEIDTSLPAEHVIRVMEQIGGWRGLPKAIRCDNGPELIAQSFVDGCQDRGIDLRHIQPGKPHQNAYIERFNRPYREEVLDAYLFEDLHQVREITHEWLTEYNEQRPHDSLGGLPSSLYKLKLETKTSTLELSG